jgi:hypothetical protein
MTIVNPAAAGNLPVFPGNAFPLGTSAINFAAGAVRANNVIVQLATDGTGTLGVQNSSGGTANLVIDVVGYFN